MTSHRPRVLAAALVAAALGVGPLVLAPATSAADDGVPVGGPTDGVSGQRAIDLLGDRLGRVASRAGWSTDRLRRELAGDAALKVATSTDGLYYVDRLEVDAAAAVTAEAGPVSGVALADTFLLHSKPGADLTVYLDANGHTTTGTQWNTICDATLCDVDPIVSAPFDVDGSPDTFSNAELSAIQGIWGRVADDYDMFDIDVTTEAPPLSDLVRSSFADPRFGQRVVLTSSNFYDPALGVALIGAFGEPVDTPAFVFNRVDGVTYSSASILAHGASHEVGHTLGLSHDGLTKPPSAYTFGTSGWGPIMGGAGIAQYITWSKGEYAFANNPQDDLAVMEAFGAPLEIDQVGGGTGNATPLTLDAGAFSANGRIETRGDQDAYALDISGRLEVTVSPSAAFEPNLDLELRLLDADGAVIATSNPAGRAAPSIGTNLYGGRYYLVVDGVGQGNPLNAGGYSDYASLGSYVLAGTAFPIDPVIGLPPVAVGAAAAGTALLSIDFSSEGSSDPEGQPLSYQWSFGDGGASTDANPTHVYAKAGKYTAVLTVADVGGQLTAASVSVTVADPAKSIRITQISGVRVRKGTVKVTVTVVDGYGNPVRSVLVRGKWDGVTTTRSAYTNSKGVATLYRYTSKATGFTTTKVSRSGRTWDNVNVSTAVPVA